MNNVFRLWMVVGLWAGVVSAQELRTLKPPLLRGIPWTIQRPAQPVDVVNAGMTTVLTINDGGFQLVRTDVRHTNTWVTADNLRYDQSAVLMTDVTTITIGSPDDPEYIVITNVITTLRENETITFPNRTYVIAALSSTTSNGVLGQMQFSAVKYLYGTRLAQPLTLNQFDRLKDWLGIE